MMATTRDRMADKQAWRGIVRQQLDALCAAASTPLGGQLHVELPHLTIRAELETVESLAGCYRQIDFQTHHPDQNRSSQSCESLEAAVRQLDYLNEPLRICEFDPESAQGLVRSWPLGSSRDGSAYFELSWCPQGGSLQRFELLEDRQRRATPLNLTHEIAERLMTDIAALWS